MDHFYFEKIKPRVLGAALLFYIMVVILLFTLAPFNYSLSHINKLTNWGWEFSDTIKNVILFIPVGFLLFPVLSGRHIYLYAILFGFLFSAFIEINQFFIPTRNPDIKDVLTNTAGTFIGCYGHMFVKNYFQKRSATLLHMGIPVMNIVFLLIPLLWLSSFAAGYEVDRLWFLLLLGIIGAILISEIYINRLPAKMIFYNVLFLILLNGWFLIGVFPSLIKYPQRILFFTFLINLLAAARMRFGYKLSNDKRFELRSLNKIIPLFAIYLVLLSQWPIEMPHGSFSFSVFSDYKLQRSYTMSIYRFVEYFAAFAMVGYLISQYVNRSRKIKNKTSHVLLWMLLFTVILEIPRGFHPAYTASLEHIVISFAWGVFGAMIYVMQLDYFKHTKISNEQRTPEV